MQDSIKAFLSDPKRGRAFKAQVYSNTQNGESDDIAVDAGTSMGYMDRGKETMSEVAEPLEAETTSRMVDVVLSDMCEPWEQTDGFYKRTLSDPYYRMMNTTGIPFRDHAGSMVRFI